MLGRAEFRQFAEDCKLFETKEASKTDVDLIFTRVNRAAPAPAGADAGGRRASTGGGAKGASENSQKMGQDEFVHAVVRLALARANNKKREELTRSLELSFAAMMKECVIPYAVFDLEDEFSDVIASRTVRASARTEPRTMPLHALLHAL